MSVVCKECGMRYTPGSESDEVIHRTYHSEHMSSLIPFKRLGVHDRVLKINKDKGEKYIQLDTRSGSTRSTSRIEKLYARIERQFQSLVTNQIQDEQKVYICVKKSTVICCLVLEPLQEATCMVIPNEDQNAKTPYVESGSRRQVECGVVTIWTHQSYRKQGVASRLLAISKCNFIFGYDVPRETLAFKQPTPDGQHFAFNFCQGSFTVY
eukprot:g8135.t1